jgi:hypothetical protein
MDRLTSRFDRALAALDAVHSEDPARELDGGVEVPAELLYARRMSARLARLAPDASEALRLAVRAQHLGRFRVPRSSQPDGRAGYLKWRTEQARAHAALAREILAEVGYEEGAIERVSSLVLKKRLASDPEAQLLEDCACLVFLEHGLEAFAEKEGDESVIAILAKTWAKMGETGRREALSLPLSARAKALVARALAAPGAE